MKLVVLGGGFTGMAVARRARARGDEVVATTRSDARAEALRAMGVRPLVAAGVTPDALAAEIDEATSVLVTMPPDGETDAAIAACAAIARARALAYVSSTAVYGDASGVVDERSPVDDAAPRAKGRLDAERVWRDAGAVVVRAPGIYGPGRGMHLRLAGDELRVAGDGRTVVSRVHVDDLAAALDAALARGARGDVYVAGDDLPAAHGEVVAWLAAQLGVAPPPHVAGAQAGESLRHDRRVDASRIRRALGVTVAYPTYREGYAHCIACDRVAIDAALSARVARGARA